MKLKVGDIIYCIKKADECQVFLTLNKGYKVFRGGYDSDICILDDDQKAWWLGQKGSSECWDRWFVSEISFIRDKKINDLLHDEEDV